MDEKWQWEDIYNVIEDSVSKNSFELFSSTKSYHRIIIEKKEF